MSDRPNNAFLLGLSSKSYEQLSGDLKKVELSLGRALMEQTLEADSVYFPVSALLSLISQNDDGRSVETSMAGSEGAAGLLEACGSRESSVDCVVQVDGQAWCSPAAHCRKLALADPEFASAAWRLTELQMAESRQSGLCQATHSVEARAARWLLESMDRSAGRNPLPMTQEFLAAMLGVQRTTVSAFAAQLQRDGLITYSRGRLRIDNVPCLEGLACECRSVTRRQRERLGLTTPLMSAAKSGPSPAL